MTELDRPVGLAADDEVRVRLEDREDLVLHGDLFLVQDAPSRLGDDAIRKRAELVVVVRSLLDAQQPVRGGWGSEPLDSYQKILRYIRSTLPRQDWRSPHTWIGATIRPAFGPPPNNSKLSVSYPRKCSRNGTTPSHQFCDAIFGVIPKLD